MLGDEILILTDSRDGVIRSQREVTLRESITEHRHAALAATMFWEANVRRIEINYDEGVLLVVERK